MKEGCYHVSFLTICNKTENSTRYVIDLNRGKVKAKIIIKEKIPK